MYICACSITRSYVSGQSVTHPHKAMPAALQVSYTARRGFYLVCPKPGASDKSGATIGPLPRAFIQLESRNRHSVDCTSHELNALNSRLKDASNDCMVLTEQVQLKFCTFVRSMSLPSLQCLLTCGNGSCLMHCATIEKGTSGCSPGFVGECIQVLLPASRCYCTDNMVSNRDRLLRSQRQTGHCCQAQTDVSCPQVLDATIATIGQDITHLHKLVDNIALLDMLCSLSMVVSRNPELYCCPTCTKSGMSWLHSLQ